MHLPGLYAHLLTLLLAYIFLPISNSRAQTPLLPQDHAWQVGLYDWLDTLTPNGNPNTGVVLPLEELTWNDHFINDDDLYRQLRSIVTHRMADGSRDLGILRREAVHFVLNTGNTNGRGTGIEGAGEVRWVSGVGPATFWYNYDVPGNVQYKQPALARRILAMVAVDMIMSQQQFDNRKYTRSFYLGGMMNMWILAYHHTKDVLTSEAQAAFQEGFEHMVRNLESWDGGFADEGKEGDLDTKTIAALARLYRLNEDPTIRSRVLTLVQNYLFGGPAGTPASIIDDRAIFHPGGYIEQNNGPATTYDGIARYYLLEAVSVVHGDPAWAFLWDQGGVVDRMLAWKSYQYLGDPDYYFDGPSGYSARTADSHVYDQQGDREWRDAYAALIYDNSKYLARQFRSANFPMFFDLFEMVDRVERRISTVNTNGYGTSDPQGGARWVLNSWPRQYPYLYDAYDVAGEHAGYYENYQHMFNSSQAEVQPYFARSDSFNINIGEADVMWAAKGAAVNQEFGFLVETFPYSGGWGGLKGGSLQAFWTDKAGIVLLSKARGRESAGANQQDKADNLDWAATHHAWGYFESGDIFSTAAEISPESIDYDITAPQPSVYYQSQIQNQKLGVTDVTEPIAYARTFSKVKGGIQISTAFTPSVAAQGQRVTELWESLPVFLRDADAHGFYEDASIDYWDGNTWTPLSTSLVTTEHLRLGRQFENGSGFVFINFDTPEQVTLEDRVWTTNYQTDNRIRNIHIDLHGNPGIASNFPETSVTYTITSVSPFNQIPEVDLGANIGNQPYTAPADILLAATANDLDGDVTNVSFYSNDVQIGNGQRQGNTWSYSWTNVQPGTYSLRAVALDNERAEGLSNVVQVEVLALPESPGGNTASSYQLLPNFPNPATLHTTLEFDLPVDSRVLIRVYDPTGRFIERIVNDSFASGIHQIDWDTSALPNGVYLVQVITDEQVMNRQVTVLKP